MIPLRDNIPTRTFSYVTYMLIVVNALVFFYELSLGQAEFDRFIFRYGYVPREVTDAFFSLRFAPEVYLTLFTSVFLHGGWVHIIGNMLYLYIFGNNVEDSMGHGRFVVFYLLVGVVANLAQIAVSPDSPVPGIGASGAIAGVLGAYLLLYPKARVVVLVPVIILFPIFTLPAAVVLVFWFVIQIFQGAVTLALGQAGMGGVAFWVHAAGFVLGMMLIGLFRKKEYVREKPTWF